MIDVSFLSSWWERRRSGSGDRPQPESELDQLTSKLYLEAIQKAED
jgi:hypothetical protein